jgi:hypothetical protein
MTLRRILTQSRLKDGGCPLRSRWGHNLSDRLGKGLGGWLGSRGRNYWSCWRWDGTRGLGGRNGLGGRGIGTICRTQGRSLGDSLIGSCLIDGSLSLSNLGLSRSNDLIGVRGGLLLFTFLTLNTDLFKPSVTKHGLNALIGQGKFTLLIPIRKLIGGVSDLSDRIPW